MSDMENKASDQIDAGLHEKEKMLSRIEELENQLNALVKNGEDYVSRVPDFEAKNKELEQKLAIAESVLSRAVCKKGCGDVELGFEGYLHCSNCGEEMENQITYAHWEYLKHKVK